jgi:hypothetical protein
VFLFQVSRADKKVPLRIDRKIVLPVDFNGKLLAAVP